MLVNVSLAHLCVCSLKLFTYIYIAWALAESFLPSTHSQISLFLPENGGTYKQLKLEVLLKGAPKLWWKITFVSATKTGIGKKTTNILNCYFFKLQSHFGTNN